jgi:macrolide phosphotransferase
LAELARRAAPELALTTGAAVENGWDNRVLFADDGGGTRWVFRFPRRDEVVTGIDRERTILQLVRDRLPAAVPDWQIDTVVDGQVVVGYPALPGEPAGYEPRGDGDFSFTIALPPPDAYPTSLGRALAGLHAIDPAEVWTTLGEAPPDSGVARERWRALHDRARELVPIPEALAAYWAERVNDDRMWDYPMVLRHGDVHPEHTLVDANGAVVGIIDWTDAGLGDPASDFLDPRHAFGPAFGDRLLAAYRTADGVADPALAERVVLLQSMGPVPSFLYGLDADRPAIAARARQRIAAMADRLARTGRPLA